MTLALATPTESQADTGRFMLTLCRLAAPVPIRPPKSPQLKPFTFFMSRALHADGREHLYLHMGYFDRLSDAERWVKTLRPRYPDAFATLASVEPLRPASSDALSLSTAPQPEVPNHGEPTHLDEDSLTDTQVLEMLEARHVYAVQLQGEERDCEEIALLRPEDTGVRRALKEAVAQDAPVSFAVQLLWSAQPIDLNQVVSLALFKSHTLYATENRREGRPRYFLRLGFFADPLSARRIAVQVRSAFGSAAVVPVADDEVTRAREAAIDNTAIPYLQQQRESSRQPRPLNDPPKHASRETEAIGRTPEPVASPSTWTQHNSLSESGVRHLRVELQERSGRWKTVRLNAEVEHESI